jgi:hypothetical protein
MSTEVQAAEFHKLFSQDGRVTQLLPQTTEHLRQLAALAAVLFADEIKEAVRLGADTGLLSASVPFYPEKEHTMFVLAEIYWQAEKQLIRTALFVCAPADFERAEFYAVQAWERARCL